MVWILKQVLNFLLSSGFHKCTSAPQYEALSSFVVALNVELQEKNKKIAEPRLNLNQFNGRFRDSEEMMMHNFTQKLDLRTILSSQHPLPFSEGNPRHDHDDFDENYLDVDILVQFYPLTRIPLNENFFIYVKLIKFR